MLVSWTADRPQWLIFNCASFMLITSRTKYVCKGVWLHSRTQPLQAVIGGSRPRVVFGTTKHTEFQEYGIKVHTSGRNQTNTRCETVHWSHCTKFSFTRMSYSVSLILPFSVSTFNFDVSVIFFFFLISCVSCKKFVDRM